MRAPDRLDARFRQPEMPDLALIDQVAHGACHIFDGDVRILAVLVEQVELLDLQAFERLLGHGANALGTAIEPLLRVAIAEAEFGGDDDLTAHRRQRFADQFFIGPVGLGRIEQGHALLHRRTDQLDGGIALKRRAVAEAQAHAAQADGRHAQSASSKFTFLHCCSPRHDVRRPLYLEGSHLISRYNPHTIISCPNQSCART
jgi:hypothetical protein